LILKEKVVIYPNPPTSNKASISLSQHASQSLDCATCHDDTGNYFVPSVVFPNGVSANFSSASANLCLNCHQGRESSVSLEAVIAGAHVSDNKIARDASGKPTLGFRNPHYFAAGASFFGGYVQGMAEFKGKKYSGLSQHPEPMNNCIACHDQHSLQVRFNVPVLLQGQYKACSDCHGDTVKDGAGAANIRVKTDTYTDTNDYDGDGNNTEGYGFELAGMAEKLYAAMQTYADKNAKADKAHTVYGIVYSATAYPYFFNDLNGNKAVDVNEGVSSNAYNAWTPNLLRAAYNYQWWQKDPGLFAHNFYYGGQALYDSIKAVRGSVVGMVRPPVPAELAPMPPKPVSP
jgi:hypothetical protein